MILKLSVYYSFLLYQTVISNAVYRDNEQKSAPPRYPALMARFCIKKSQLYFLLFNHSPSKNQSPIQNKPN